MITTTNTNRIKVAKTPIVAIVPRFMRPSSPNVTQPINQRDSLISKLLDTTSSNLIRTVYLFQYYTYIPPILPDFLRLIAKGSNTQLKEIGCHIPDSVHIVAISVRFSKKGEITVIDEFM